MLQLLFGAGTDRLQNKTLHLKPLTADSLRQALSLFVGSAPKRRPGHLAVKSPRYEAALQEAALYFELQLIKQVSYPKKALSQKIKE